MIDPEPDLISTYSSLQSIMVLVLLPGGKFFMGAQRTDENGENYDPVGVELVGDFVGGGAPS